MAFHGSWNRAPKPQSGFQVVYQSFTHEASDGDWQTFAGPTGFTGERSVRSPGSADHRPAGLAVDANGALYISDDHGSTIYRVTYRGASK